MKKKKNWKRGNETYTGTPILFYILQRIQGNINHLEKEIHKGRLVA
jgi:hypothetical protein